MTSILRAEGFTLLGERVLLKPDEAPSKVGRIIIPDRCRKPSSRATVASMGPGMLTKSGGRWPMPDIKVGDKVYFDARVLDYAPKFKIDGEEYVVVFADRIEAVEEPS